jgi:hypothetical protein
LSVHQVSETAPCCYGNAATSPMAGIAKLTLSI